MLVDEKVAKEFLACYIALLAEINGNKIPEGVGEYVRCRDLVYSNLVRLTEYRSIGDNFKRALIKAVYGRFIFLKKYKSWYAFQNMESGQYFAALGLLSPIETLLPDFSVIKTAMVPLNGLIVCDGLIVNSNILLGKNMVGDCRNGYMEAKRTGKLIRELE